MKQHKNKNRLTIICIAISVMLVTAIFSMADISLKAQKQEALKGKRKCCIKSTAFGTYLLELFSYDGIEGFVSGEDYDGLRRSRLLK